MGEGKKIARIAHGLDSIFRKARLPGCFVERALSVLAYNLTRAMNIVGIKLLIAAMVA